MASPLSPQYHASTFGLGVICCKTKLGSTHKKSRRWNSLRSIHSLRSKGCQLRKPAANGLVLVRDFANPSAWSEYWVRRPARSNRLFDIFTGREILGLHCEWDVDSMLYVLNFGGTEEFRVSTFNTQKRDDLQTLPNKRNKNIPYPRNLTPRQNTRTEQPRRVLPIRE